MFGRSSGKIDLPSMPATLARIIQITNSPDAAAEEVSGVVMLDPALSTKVLRLANSAFYGRRVKAETITEAVVALGFVSVRNLAASAAVVDALFPRRLFPGFSWQDMWIHSVTCAVAAEVIYSRVSRDRHAGESAFAAGLLHDVGKLIFARALPQRFIHVVEACRETETEMICVEGDLVGTDHAKIGGELAKQWEFPDKLCIGIAYHHAPEMAPDYEDIAKAVNGANMLAKRLSRHYINGVRVQFSLKEIADMSGVAISEMEYIINEVRKRVLQCGEILSWGDGMPGAKRAA